MKDSLLKFGHEFSLDPKWLRKFVSELGCQLVDDRLLIFPEDIAQGGSYFLEILPDVSVLVIDMKFMQSIEFTRFPSMDECWIIYYDMSEFLNEHILEGIKHITGIDSSFTFAIVDSSISSTYRAKKDERVFFLRIFIRKTFLKSMLNDDILLAKFNFLLIENQKFFYGLIDSKSKMMLYKLQQYKIDDFNYEFILKSVSYNLLGYFTDRLILDISSSNMYVGDREAIIRSHKFLLSNLYIPFPGMIALAKYANMSVSKYINLFKEIYGLTPVSLFRKEKLLLAKKLLESGEFKRVYDVAYFLGFQKASYFSLLYYKEFGLYPMESVYQKNNSNRIIKR
ncbi:helix-turn-helix domain-containing protein [Myroides odoratus]|uniref:helix-turn-helix domain-containing protein n=1 Tax=Myroides odoratus TaxID=256 RepID=UPI000765F7DB|nr:helix-turn-helix domain-containing protein [Myroides odoratus]